MKIASKYTIQNIHNQFNFKIPPNTQLIKYKAISINRKLYKEYNLLRKSYFFNKFD